MEKLSNAEERAVVATKLAPFPIQLHEVRRTVKEILDLFGRGTFFQEYTIHSFAHIEAMLADLDWLIPDKTQTVMTPADWLLITLSIYFHDLGLIVTEDEFKNRASTDFTQFCNDVLFTKKRRKRLQSKDRNARPGNCRAIFLSRVCSIQSREACSGVDRGI